MIRFEAAETAERFGWGSVRLGLVIFGFIGLCEGVLFTPQIVGFITHSEAVRAAAMTPMRMMGVVTPLIAVALMSIPSMVYIVFGQAVLALLFNYFPVFGFDMAGIGTLRFLLLPVALMALMGVGGDVRLYRAVFLEEIAQDYVRTAQAKGVPQARLLFVHVLKNGMISLITLVVAHLPHLVMGSLLVENFFGIPGLGNTLFLAIQQSDYATVFASVYLGSLLYIVGLILTDICYALADPRIRLS